MNNERKGADLILNNIGQLVTLTGHSRRAVVRPKAESLGLLEGKSNDLCIASSNGLISFIGNRSEISEKLHTGNAAEIDCKGKLVTPGFVDSHTHCIFAGSREGELAMKLSGMSYSEILASGGGILKTVNDTREATNAEIIASTRKRLDSMVSFGTTTFEVKSGYSLTVNGEIRLLELLRELGSDYDLESTLLSAHAIPREYSGRNQAYIEEVVIPSINVCADLSLSKFCDVFLEEGAFGYKEAERLLMHAQRIGFRLKIHADEFSDQGGALLASELGAVSADHLGRASIEGMRSLGRKGVIGVLLPGTLFSSFAGAYAKAREMIECNVPVALATDMNPNSWIESMQFVCSLACYGMRLSPEEALVGATINGAHAIARASSVGSIELGKNFDVLLFDLKNYAEIPYRIGSNNVEKVIKKGKIVSDR